MLRRASAVRLYASTRGAIASLTIALSILLAPEGIRVSCVAQGPIWTPIQPVAKSPKELLRSGARRRSAAPAYVLLASQEGSYLTGTLVPFAGGRSVL